MEHIERMKKELEELETKIENLEKFLESEFSEHRYTDEIQRVKLACQAEHMHAYAIILEERIKYDTKKANSEKCCSVSGNYDTVVDECFK